MSKSGTEVKVVHLPDCDIHLHEKGQAGVKAAYDGKTIFRVRAYMCDPCFKERGIGLGTGRGQKLIPVVCRTCGHPVGEHKPTADGEPLTVATCDKTQTEAMSE